MSLLMSLAAIPMEAVLPVAESLAGTAANVARPVAGLGAVFAFLMVFKPLLRGLWRAAVLSVLPRVSLAQRKERDAGAAELEACRFDGIEPALAAEIRAAVKRGN